MELAARQAVAASAHEDCGRGDTSPDGHPASYTPEVRRTGFAVKFDDDVSPHGITSIFVMPGREALLEAVLLSGGERFEAGADAGRLTREGPAAWRYMPPEEPGIYPVVLRETDSGHEMIVNVFVLQPYRGEDVLDGYRIGRYERLPLRSDPAYAMPAGLVRVTRANQDTWISPHFQLRQFVCKQEAGYPRFLILRTRLITKLEMLVEALEERDVDLEGLFIMSGYRTPWYNRAIGNRTSYSRHAYGDAADVFVDEDGNGWMDDLDGDGRATLTDARMIAAAVEEMADDAWYAAYQGGLGLYGPKPHRGPFVHVDARGRRARW